MEKKNYTRELYIGLSVIFIYFVTMYSQEVVSNLFGIKDAMAQLIFIIMYQLTVILFIAYLYRIELRNNFRAFWAMRKTHLKACVPYLLTSYALVGVSNMIITTITNTNLARNQEEIMKMADSIPITTVILAVIYAPIIEELVFRLSIRKLFRNNIIFIVVSSLIFGSLHVIGYEYSSWTEYLFVISYCIPGIVFAYALIKSRNIFFPILLHFINNAIGVGAMILLGILQ